MKIFFLLAILFHFNTTFCQDSLQYKNKIDSILFSRANDGVKIIKAKEGSTRLRYFFVRATKILDLIEVAEPIDDKEVWIYNYHFYNGKLIMLNKYNNHGIKDKKREIAFYYLKDGIIYYREENKTKISDLELRIKKGMELQQNSPSY